MISKEDLKIESVSELVHFLPIFIFIAFVGPFLLAAYTVGFFLDITGKLES